VQTAAMVEETYFSADDRVVRVKIMA